MKFSKPRYSEDEVKEVLESLFVEKKRAKDLQQALDQSKEAFVRLKREAMNAEKADRTPAAEERLREEISKNQTLFQDLRENSLYIGELQQQLGKLQRVIESLEADKGQIPKAVEVRIEQLEEQIQRQKQHNETLTHALQDKERRISTLNESLRQAKAVEDHTQELEKILTEERHHFNVLKEEKEHAQQKLAESRLHAEQLERGIQYIQGKLAEANTDKDLLGTELLETRKQLLAVEQQQQVLQDLSTSIENQRAQEQKEYLEQAEELKAIQGQFENLKSAIRLSKQEAEKNTHELAKSFETIEELKIEKSRLESELEDKKSRYEEAKLELQTHKEAVLNGVQTIREIEEQARKSEEEASSIRLELERSVERLMETVKEKERSLEAKNTQINQIQQENQKVQDYVAMLQHQLEDKESQIKMAQQHMAKKMREMATTQEKLEEQKMQILDLQNHLNQSHTKMGEVRNQLDVKQMQEKRLEELLVESQKTASRWEDKFFKLSDRLQELESQNQELRFFKQRYQQMQTLLSNFGAVLEPSSVPPLPIQHPKTSSVEETPKQAHVAEVRSESDFKPSKGPGDLFSPSQSPQRLRQTLFDE